jgi:hypothetical protein
MNRKPRHYPEPAPALEERRQEERRVASGAGWIEPLEGGAREELQLVDMSGSGFRGLHGSFTLCAGQRVRFQYPRHKGVAVVMWNRLLGGHVESGFLIVSRSL